MKKFLLILAVPLLFSQCKPKEIITYKDRIVQDTIIRNNYKTITVPGRTITEIKEICKDSTPQQFKKVYIRETDTVIVEVDKSGNLRIEMSEKERVISDLQDRYRALAVTLKETKETTLVKKDLTGYFILLALLIVGYFVGGANGLIRRLLKFL